MLDVWSGSTQRHSYLLACCSNTMPWPLLSKEFHNVPSSIFKLNSLMMGTVQSSKGIVGKAAAPNNTHLFDMGDGSWSASATRRFEDVSQEPRDYGNHGAGLTKVHLPNANNSVRLAPKFDLIAYSDPYRLSVRDLLSWSSKFRSTSCSMKPCVREFSRVVPGGIDHV